MIVHIDHIALPGGPSELPKYSRVKFDAGLGHLRLATELERSDGTLARQFVPSLNSDGLVIPWHNGGTRMMRADGAIVGFGYYKNADNGKITAADESNAKGRLMADASVKDGDEIECSPYSNAD